MQAPIDVIIEISAGSRVKQSIRDGVIVEEFRSPLPSLFNYGAAEGTTAPDGEPIDVVVLGARLAVGTRLQVWPVAMVRFFDEDVRDDKLLARPTPGALSWFDRCLAAVFFTVYAAYKRRRGTVCRFEGIDPY